jgi:hypothetical protein
MAQLLDRLREEDDYYRMAARERTAPRPPQDMTNVFAEYTPVTDSGGRDRDNIRRFTDSKGFGIGELVKQSVRFTTTRAGEVFLAYPLRCADGEPLAGKVIGIKLRAVRTGRKWCESGTRIGWPAIPSLYGSPSAETIYVCEGESDAGWLLANSDPTAAVYCLHGGAALWDARWAIPLVEATAKIVVATDNDHDRPVDHLGVQNIGEKLARRIMSDVPRSRRLRPPLPARDWCEVTS